MRQWHGERDVGVKHVLHGRVAQETLDVERPVRGQHDGKYDDGAEHGADAVNDSAVIGEHLE